MVRKRAQLAKMAVSFIMQTFQVISIKFNAPTNDKRQVENKAHLNLFLVASAR